MVACADTEERIDDLAVIIVDDGVEVIISVKFRVICRRQITIKIINIYIDSLQLCLINGEIDGRGVDIVP